MKKNNLLRIGWVVGIYAILVLILYLVVTYKVKWEDRDLNTYQYFYNCSGELCTTTKKLDDYYGKIVCDNDDCPYIKEKNNDYLILSYNKKQLLYNYKKDTVISDTYTTYKLTSDNNYIVTNKEGKYAIINNDNEILYDFSNKKIVDYKDDYITYIKDNKYGIFNETNDINIEPNYEKVILIDNKKYGYLEDEKYYIASYDTEIPTSNNTYDYIISINNILLTFKNKQLDILDNNLKSKLVMKIDCKYNYRVEKEQKTLNIRMLNNLVVFSIYIDNDEYIEYYYDLKNNKLLS